MHYAVLDVIGSSCTRYYVDSGPELFGLPALECGYNGIGGRSKFGVREQDLLSVNVMAKYTIVEWYGVGGSTSSVGKRSTAPRRNLGVG